MRTIARAFARALATSEIGFDPGAEAEPRLSGEHANQQARNIRVWPNDGVPRHHEPVPSTPLLGMSVRITCDSGSNRTTIGRRSTCAARRFYLGAFEDGVADHEETRAVCTGRMWAHCAKISHI